MSDPKPLAGLAAFVTGGSGGIGWASAARLARDGAAVLLMARRETELEKARAALIDACPGAEVRISTGDASNARDVQRALDRALAMRGRLDMIVATVGGSLGLKPLLMHDVESFTRVIDRNLTSAFLAMRYGVPLMTAGGSVVCISSVCATLPSTHLTPYCASKGALESLVRGAAKEFARLNVRVNAVRPGMTQAAGVTSMFGSDELRARAKQVIPLGRMGAPEEIAEAVRYLAGPESKWVTGQSFAVDGGSELALNRLADDRDTEIFGKDWPAPWGPVGERR